MLRQLRNLDRRRALALGLVLASAGILAAGVTGMVFALTSSGAELPNEGSIEEIVGQADGQAAGPAPTDAPIVQRGPLPVRFIVPALYIDAPVITEGVGEDALPRVPGRPDQVAWYDFSATPGSSSNAVFAGHVDWQTSDRIPIPGVFYRLRELKIGDEISVALEDGTRLEYRVTGNVATPYDDPNVVKVMSPTDRDVITVITCGGTWLNSGRSAYGGNYSHRVIVRAERVTGAGAANAASAGGS